jgi:anti-sigma factor RsiW
MNHDRARPLLAAWADRECGPLTRFRVGRHVASCPLCTAEVEAMQVMRTAIRTSLPVHRAPPALAARIGAALPREAPPPIRRAWFEPRLAGGTLAGCLAGVALTLLVTHGGPARDPMLAELVDEHVRSLMTGHLMDVETSDRHTVKPWLSARLDLSPVVRDHAADGFPLAGGRLDYVDGHEAAAIVYRRDRHVINLFAFRAPGPAESAPVRTARDGFNVVRWRMGGIAYAAVSDVELAQLMTFVDLVRADGG